MWTRTRSRRCSRCSGSRWSRCRTNRRRNCRCYRWANCWSHRRRWGDGRRRRRRLARPRGVVVTGNRHARSNINRVNAPAFAGATRVTGHSPAQPSLGAKPGNVHHRGNESSRIAAPSLTTCNRTTPISANGAVVAPHQENATSGKDVLECISIVKTDLKHSAVETQVRILARRFKIEVLSKGQLG